MCRPCLVFPLQRKLWFSLAEGFVVLPRGSVPRCSWSRGRWSAGRVVAGNGGPSLVSGCCGSTWAADRPRYGRFRTFTGRVAGRLHWGVSRPAHFSGYSVSVVCLSMMICSTALAVYPQSVSWFR